MVVKVYVSGISGNKEVKKRQQRVLMILDSRNIKYVSVDIAEPDNEKDKDFMQNNSKSLGATVSDTNPRHPLPPQLFNDLDYCGDYDQFDMANEIDELEKFLKLAADDTAPTVTSTAEVQLGNGDAAVAAVVAAFIQEEETNEAEAAGDTSEAEAAVQLPEDAEVDGNDADEAVPESNGDIIENGDLDDNDGDGGAIEA